MEPDQCRSVVLSGCEAVTERAKEDDCDLVRTFVISYIVRETSHIYILQ